jgi:hypothetical protein
MRFAIVAVVGAMITGGCATLLTPSGSAADRWATLEKARAAKQHAALSGEELICKSMPVLGSNMPQKVCSSQEEWDRFDKAGQEGLENIRNQSGQYGSGFNQGETGVTAD